MHILQQKILKLVETYNLNQMSLRQIGKLIKENHPQKVKHHLAQLTEKGLIKFNKKKQRIEKVKQGSIKDSPLLAVPILGAANCGDAKIFADENPEGFLRISSKLLKQKKRIFAIKAKGFSMNRSNINGKSIEDGDYVIINSNDRIPRNGDYVLSIIDDCANIKRYFKDEKNKQIVLLSESTANLPSIYIHPKDSSEYMINGKVIQVIKKPRLK